MQKAILLSILMAAATAMSMAEQPLRMRPADRIAVDLFTDIWQNTPEGMDLKTINRGVSVNLLYDMPLGRSNFSLAAGTAITSHNLYSDHVYAYSQLAGHYEFMPITHDYNRNKVSLNYLDLPVQFRYRSRDLPYTFRFYAGIRAGYLINAHTKYVGKLSSSPPGWSSTWPGNVLRDVKYKEHRLGQIEKFRLGLTGTIGYGQVNLHVHVPLTKTFTGNNAADMQAVSAGVTFIVF